VATCALHHAGPQVDQGKDIKQIKGTDMQTIKTALEHLNSSMNDKNKRAPISFEQYLQILAEKPHLVLRSIFQLFHDMIKAYIGEGIDEYPDDPESIHFVDYDCSRLFVQNSDHPFFADRLFANRLINLVEAFKHGTQQNKIYIFEGPPGSGKSTFLNNLLLKFEEYTLSQEGMSFETVWLLSRKILDGLPPNLEKDFKSKGNANEETVEIPCPSHDNPILMIPKNHRKQFLEQMFSDEDFKERLYTAKEFDWVFKDRPCTICSSLYEALLDKLGSAQKVYQAIYARPRQYNRQLGEGISVFTSGDKPLKQDVMSNPMLQRRINSLLKDSNRVKYIFSQYAKTNNGIYALMDIKSYNTERLIELHNIISEGVHKVDDIEEYVNSMFIALMNPEDKVNVADIQSFSDRIEYINIPYILDLNTEVEIYRNIFGKQTEEKFLPRVLHNFARVVISSRLNPHSEALLEWIGNPSKYKLYCDENLLLLKMEIYRGHIPPWLSEEDRKRLTAKRRRRIIAESEKEGDHGFSGRDSIKIFNEFYSTFAKKKRLINMNDLHNYFTRVNKELNKSIPRGFLDSLMRMYNYTLLQKVKECLYYYNEEQISRDIQNYLFAINFEVGAEETCTYTGEKIEISEDFLKSIENRLLGSYADRYSRFTFRMDTQIEYTSVTLPQEILLEDKDITKTKLFKSLHERYTYNLKEKVLDPFLDNENFRAAIRDYDQEEFKTYDKRIKEDVNFLINNLCQKYDYTAQGAKEVCMYVIDNNLARHYGRS
jgi:predicted Ser/Thr protein kinase